MIDHHSPSDSEPASPDDATETAVEAVAAFVDATTDALESADASSETVQAVKAAGDQLTDAVDDLAMEVRAASTCATAAEAELDELETKLQTERETRAREAAEDRKRLHSVEERVDDLAGDDDATTETADTPTANTPDPGPEPRTPLEDVIRIPEHLAAENLTANQRRARFVAKDIHEYTQRVPAGRAIKSSELRRVLTAGEDAQIYTQTVSRVVEFLDELGGEAVQVQESKRGERVIVFTEAFVNRVRAHQRHAERNTVVTDAGVAR
ncbi:hypothetical protein [Halorubrum sp. N11]|uniref:hypothetical protein n=1 Tax=Halorubrum sp. N11 TaxID=3402276 RepID=UPI003EBC61A2